MANGLRVRRSLYDLQDDYIHGHKKPLEDLLRAWKAFKERPADELTSFFMLGGYHGEPFRGAGASDGTFWGGYCNHGNILFPTWHRVYILKVEDALRSVDGCEDVTLPFWDEASPESQKRGIPWALTQETFELDGETIANPLRSFVLPRAIKDRLQPDPQGGDYSKPFGYETVRYPLSGLMGKTDIDCTKEHNKQYPYYDTNVTLLNHNVINWLTSSVVINGKAKPTHVVKDYEECLDAPNYTVFSNTTSAHQWNDDHDDGGRPVTPLESPHNSIHLAVGGFDVPDPKQPDFSPIQGANGDMGENDTASMDPIFYFHHSFVDRVFWLWQKKHGCTHHLEVMGAYPGTNSIDGQGPTPGTPANAWLTLASPLTPFMLGDRPYTSLDCIHIEEQLGYTYGPGSLEEGLVAANVADGRTAPTVKVWGVDRAQIRGSFLISVFADIADDRHHLGTEAVLSRWTVQGCANCQTHLEAKAFIGLHDLDDQSLAALRDEDIQVEIRTHEGVIPRQGPPVAEDAAVPSRAPARFWFELRRPTPQ